MFKKIILPILLLTLLSITLIGCNSNEIFPEAIPLENSIKEIILSKGENYDFINDELFMNKAEEYANDLIKIKSDTSKYYAIGNMDEDNIPELVVFIERKPEDVKDEGGLGVYKFNGEKYELIDKISMNYDNTNYLLEIGKISPTQNGLLLSNQIGAHSGITYGYILENNKLKSILNDKKISLLSVYTSNEIKDIDNDGILEFSIYTIDPETEEQSSVGSDKLVLWYKWDGKDGGELVDFVKISNQNQMDLLENSIIAKEANDLGDMPPDKLIEYIDENKSNMDKYTLTQALDQYLIRLNDELRIESIESNLLLKKYKNSLITENYDLSIERLNDLDYLKREKVLQSEEDLKKYLIQNINIGYKLDFADNKYFYKIDYQKIFDKYNDLTTKDFRDYLKIKALNNNDLIYKDKNSSEFFDNLADRISYVEMFKLTYPYSKYLNEVNEIYNSYINYLLLGSDSNPHYDLHTNKYNEKVKNMLTDLSDKYIEKDFSNIIKDFLNRLSISSNLIDDSFKDYMKIE